MYGRGNYTPQFRHGTETSLSTSQQLVPPHLPPPYQHGSKQSEIFGMGPPSFPAPHVNQPGPTAYASEHRVSAPTTGILSSVQSYLTPFPPPPPLPQGHGIPMGHPFANAQQNPQWTQNVQQVRPPLPPTLGRPPSGRNGPEILLPPPPPRVLPPPLSQVQALFRGPVCPPPPASVQGIQHTPLPQPPIPNALHTRGYSGSVLHPNSQDSQISPGMLSAPLPPASPPGPPPLPPSSPPQISPSVRASTGAHPPPSLLDHSKSDGSSNRQSNTELIDSNPIAKISAPIGINDNLQDNEMGTLLEVDSLVEQGLSSEEYYKFDLLQPPPKPREERVARRIEVLCQYIARNGPGFEEKTRKNELGNPEFEFLFGGMPGSEAAAAHEYFIWMKRKCSLPCKLDKGKQQSNDSSSRPVQHGSSMDAGVSHSSADSDMDIEDETPEIPEKQKFTELGEGLIEKSVLTSSEHKVEEQLHEQQLSAECMAPPDSVSRNTFRSDASEFVEKIDDVSQCHASDAAAGVDFGNVSTQLVTGTSAFKLLQEYASDDSSEGDNVPSIRDTGTVPVSPSGKSVCAHLDGEKVFEDVVEGTIKKNSESEDSAPSSEHVVAWAASMPSKSMDSSRKFQIASKEGDAITVEKGQCIDSGISVGAFRQKATEESRVSAVSDSIKTQKDDKKATEERRVSVVSDSIKTEKDDKKYNSTQLKVDEFGRLVREGASDSDSDDLRYSRRHGRKGRSRSRSRSPHGRRSLQRRREKRSRSRSRSPKKRKSRSRSPFRQGNEYGRDRTRRDKDPLPACFDYKRGKCYRGASCRYLHNDSIKGDALRRYRSKYQDVLPTSKSARDSVHELDKVKNQEMEPSQDLTGDSVGASMDSNVKQKELVMSGKNVSDEDVELLINSVADSVRAREGKAQLQETKHLQEESVESLNQIPNHNVCLEVGATPQMVDSYAIGHITDADTGKLPPGDTCHDIKPSSGKSVVQQPQRNPCNSLLQSADYQSQQMDVPFAYSSPSVQASGANSNLLPVTEPHPDTISEQSYPATGSASKPHSSETFSSQHLGSGDFSSKNPYPSSQFQPPPPPLQATNSASLPQMHGDYSMMSQIARYQSYPTQSQNRSPYQAPFSQQFTNFSGPPTSAWNSLPPPPPPHLRYGNDSNVHTIFSSNGMPSLQFQQNQLPQRNDCAPQEHVGPYPTEIYTHSQDGNFHHRAYPPMLDPNQPLPDMEHNKSIPMTISTTQQLGDPGVLGEDRVMSLPVLSAQGSMNPQPMPFSRGSPAGRMQSFDSDNLHSAERTVDSGSVHLGKPGKINSEFANYTTDYIDRNQSSVPEFVGSRIPTYFNPYASTFEHPASSKISCDVMGQAKGASYNNDVFTSSHVLGDSRVVDSLDSKNITCSPNSNQAVEKMLPKSSCDQYDPLLDSIEPSLNLTRTSSNDQKRETTAASDILVRLSGSNKPLDLAETTEQRESEAVALTSSPDNDEYGETADAEVGAVENFSPCGPINETNTAEGEIEIDQIKTSGKTKKGKDSRSMKLFKGALADFVKEVLKPSWRQGNMSKEAFKTIVKKTVDKVSGAMKSHQVPKSQTKIDHYIDSSQRKLTKLVMGYVDKYVKV